MHEQQQGVDFRAKSVPTIYTRGTITKGINHHILES